jgi:pimeloyl-ACP methyl ester carboxylesterase
MPRIKVNDADLFYTDDGEGKPIVFIHGLGSDHRMFEPQVDTFKKSYRLICPDTRGNGESGQLNGPVSTVLDRQCDDIAALLDQLGIRRAVFCGTSYGGVVCQHFVLRCADRVAGLVICDSFGDTKVRSLPEALLLASQYASLWAYYFPAMLAPSLRWQYRKWPQAQKHIVEASRSMRSHETLLQRLAINRADHTSQLGRVICPVLGMVGDYSKILIRYMSRMVGAIPNARLEIIRDSLDPSNLCQQETYDSLVKAFLSDIGW